VSQKWRNWYQNVGTGIDGRGHGSKFVITRMKKFFLAMDACYELAVFWLFVESFV